MTDEAPIGYFGGARQFRKEINAHVYGLPRYYDNTLSGRVIYICQKCEHSRRARRFRGACPVVSNPFEGCEKISDIIEEGFHSPEAIEARAFAEAVRMGVYEKWAEARREAVKAKERQTRSEFTKIHGCFIYYDMLEREVSDYQHKLREEHQREVTRKRLSCKTRGSNVCTILKSHCEILSDDPERLPTEFLKKLIGPEAENC